jgi:predicted SprT family Zn-dependent metalloprotease
MQDLGLDPKVHHNYEVKRNKLRQEVVYTCKKCGTEIVRRRRLAPRRRYYHVQCGGQIAFQAIRSVT